MSDTDPSEHPFGETENYNFNPEQVNTPEDAAEVLEWIAGENDEQGNHREAEVFRDAADMVRTALVDD